MIGVPGDDPHALDLPPGNLRCRLNDLVRQFGSNIAQSADDGLARETEWTVIPSAGAGSGRGIGVVDMARAIRCGVPHRASGEMALHVLEMMAAIERSAAGSGFESVESVFDIPAELAPDWDPRVRAA